MRIVGHPTEYLLYLLAGSLIFVIPWENSVLISGIGTISRLIGLVAFFVCFLAIVHRGFLIVDGSLILVFIFVTYLALVSLDSFDPEATEARIKTFFQLSAMCFIFFQALSTMRRFVAAVLCYLFGCAVAVALLWHAVASADAAEWARFAAVGFDPNDSAIIIATGVPLASWLRYYFGRWYVSLCCHCYPLAAIAAIMSTGSRTGSVAVTIAVLGSWTTELVHAKSKLVFLLIAFATLATVPVVYKYAPWSARDRIVHALERPDYTAGSRQMIWKVGLAEFRRAPLFGNGAGTFSQVVRSHFSQLMAPHNLFIALLVEAGLIGTILFLLILAAVLWRLSQLDRISMLCWGLTLFVLFIGTLTLNFEWRKQTWLIFTFIVILGRLAQIQAPVEALLTPPGRRLDLSLATRP